MAEDTNLVQRLYKITPAAAKLVDLAAASFGTKKSAVLEEAIKLYARTMKLEESVRFQASIATPKVETPTSWARDQKLTG